MYCLYPINASQLSGKSAKATTTMDHNQASILEPEEVGQVLKTNLLEGLTTFEARERLKRYGLNKLDNELENKTYQKVISKHSINYFKQFLNPLIQLLMVCVIVSLCVGEFENACGVLVSIFLVCTISFVQDYRADRSLEKLNKQMPNVCKVIRENQAHELESHYLVPGDIVQLNEGQRVPADVRLFDLHSLLVNEANLTGETQAQIKQVSSKTSLSRLNSILLNGTFDQEKQADEDKEEKEDREGDLRVDQVGKNFIHQNLALMGTMIEAGHSRGIVISTGKATRYGEVFSMLKNTLQPRSPLQNNIDQLSLHLVIISCSVITLMSMVGIVQKRPMLDVAYYAISLAVTAIPEGLPVVVAVIMALGVLRLSKRRTIVKSLNSIETLGCVQVLCADKTGTLTRNDMTLTDIVTSELHSLSSDELEELNHEECRKHMTFNKFGGKMYSIGRLMEVGTLCNNASLDMTGKPTDDCGQITNRFIGQATECAILDASIRMGFGDSRTKFDRISETPFKSSSRRMIVQCQRRDLPGSSPMFYVKGAWEEILADCSFHYDCGLIKPRSEEIWAEYRRICSTLGSQGLRVLALATGPSMDKLTFVGIIGINNALKEGIANTIFKLKREFYIDIKMITGDSKETAVAIGRSLGLIDSSNEYEISQQIMSGEQIDMLLESKSKDDSTKAREILSRNVFYRVDPVQKADIVGKIQELDKIVAMTGDGINDVISLKKANLSLVMGSGADVCKEIADVIVVDNDLSILINAIIEGKGIYHKIRSFMSYQISISLSLVLLVAISFGLKTAPPFTVMQLLFINLLTDGPPAQTLGVERVDEKDLNLKPRDVHEPIINLQLARTLIILTFAFFVINGSLYFSLVSLKSELNFSQDENSGINLSILSQLEEDGILDAEDRSMLFTCYVFCSIFATISLRSRVSTNHLIGVQ